MTLPKLKCLFLELPEYRFSVYFLSKYFLYFWLSLSCHFPVFYKPLAYLMTLFFLDSGIRPIIPYYYSLTKVLQYVYYFHFN